MKTVNAKLYAIKYKLKKILEASINKDNEAIKNGAKITFSNYAKIQAIQCTRKSYTKEAQKLIDKFAEENHLEKVETNFIRIDIDNIDVTATQTAEKIFKTLEDNNDKTISRVASKVASIK